MRRWFLSYNSQDLALTQGLAEALRRRDDGADLFFAPASLRAGGFWLPELAKEIAESSVFLLLVGSKGVGPWQVMEYYEALDRRVKQSDYALILVLLEGQPAPSLPFLRQLHWIITADPTADLSIAQMIDAASGGGAAPGELWRHTAPYRGLAAMTEADCDAFFGRDDETLAVIKAMADASDRIPILLGNSGVGKSSLAQAGVLAALARQSWPDQLRAHEAWPHVFNDSRRWCVVKLKPGTEPVRALVEPFMRIWQFDPTDPRRETRQTEWIESLLTGQGTLRGLLDATAGRVEELGHAKPPGFLIYVDQGEELYVRAEARQRKRFSEILVKALGDPRLRILMSLRADFLGALQNDEPLFNAHMKFDVPPLRETQLLEVVSKPAALLGARFETGGLAADIARRTAEESAKDAGALPLLSYLLDDMWTQMVQRGDGVLRLPAQAVELGGVLAERANAYLASRPGAEMALRRILTLKLATVRADGEPTRRRASRSEFTDEEWLLVSELADHPHRLLITAAPDGGENYAEIAHEAIFRRWQKLREWIAAERDFLAWRSGLEGDWRAWKSAPEPSKNDALLMGLALAQAHSWLLRRAEDISRNEREFIEASLRRETLEREQRERLRRRALYVAAVALVVVTALAAFAGFQWFETAHERAIAEQQRNLAVEREQEATAQRNLAVARETEAKEQRQQMLLTRARLVAAFADQRLRSGEATMAMLFALEAFTPDAQGATLPYVPEAEAALANAWQELRERIILRGHTGELTAVVFSADGRFVVTASTDQTARIWNVADGSERVALRGQGGSVRAIAISADGRRVVTGDSGNTARLWDADSGKLIREFKGHTDWVRGVDISPDGRRVVTGSDDQTARIWDTDSGQELRVIKAHTDWVRAVAFSPDGRRIVTAGDDRMARLWDANDGRELAEFRGHENWVVGAKFNRGGNRVLTSSYDRTARVWDAESGKELLLLKGHADQVHGADFSPDGELIVSASTDKTARVWDAYDGRERYIIRGHENWVTAVAFSPDGRHIVTASNDRTARLWDARADRDLMTFGSRSGFASWAEYSGDGKLVVTISGGSARIWNAETGEELRSISDESMRTASLSRDGTRLVTTSGHVAKLWDLQSGALLHTLAGHGDDVRSAALSPDGRWIMTGGDDKTARLWDAQNGRELQVFRAHTDWVRSVAFTPDGRHVLTGSDDSTARLWDAESGKEIRLFKGHSNYILSVAISGDGRRMVTASTDRTARVWDLDTGANLAVLRGHEERIGNAAFSPDGRRIATASDDNTVRIWSAETGRELMLVRHARQPQRVAIGPGGQRLLIASSGDGARIWRTFNDANEAVEQAKAAAPRCLTTEQREEAFLDPAAPTWCFELSKWPYDTGSTIQRIGAQCRDGRFDAGFALLAETLARVPTQAKLYEQQRARCHSDRAWARYKAGEFPAALIDIDVALAIEEKSANYRDMRGQIYFSLGRFDDALADLDNAIADGADYVITFVTRGKIYERQGRDNMAIADYRKALTMKPHDDVDKKALEEARARLAELGIK